MPSSIDLNGKFMLEDVLVNPAALTIVVDPEHVLFQERALWAVNEQLVTSINENGFVSKIIIGEDGENLVVVAGRGRTKAAIEAGLTSIPAVNIGNIAQYSKFDLQSLAVSENEKRTNSSTFERAQEAKNLYETYLNDIRDGQPEELRGEFKASASEKKSALEAVAAVFGLSVSRLKDLFNVLDEERVSPALHKAIQNEEISFKAAIGFMKLDPKTQEAMLEKLKPVMARKAKESEATGGKKPKSVSASEADKVINQNSKVKIERGWLEKIKARRSTPADVKDFIKELLNPGSTDLAYLPGKLEPLARIEE